jgi:hypothetical protein
MSYTAHFINGPRHGDISIIPERTHHIVVALNDDGMDMWSNRSGNFSVSSRLSTGTYHLYIDIADRWNNRGRGDELIYVWDGKR